MTFLNISRKAFYLETLVFWIRRWYESGWRPCSRSCGKGIQLKQILCRQKIAQGNHTTLPDAMCTGKKPEGLLRQDCNKVACSAEWRPNAWTEVRLFLELFHSTQIYIRCEKLRHNEAKRLL